MRSTDTPQALQAPARASLPRHALRLHHKLARDSGVLALPGSPAPAGPVSNRQLSGLPDAARRYLRFMGVTGRPADWSFLAHCTGRFRLRPSWPWLPCEAWQYNSSLEVARVFHLRIGGPVPMSARDAYIRGEGSVHGTLLGLVHLVNGTGPEYDVSELVTYLNDAIFCAPGMLLTLPVTWTDAGDDCFDVTLRDAGHRVTARVFLDRAGRAGRLQHRGPLVRPAWRAGPGALDYPGAGLPPGGRPLAADPRHGHLASAGRGFQLRRAPLPPGYLTYNVDPPGWPGSCPAARPGQAAPEGDQQGRPEGDRQSRAGEPAGRRQRG